MADDVRMSQQTILLVKALLLPPSDWRYGYELSRQTGLKSGTLYPILVRLTERKWLEARWEHPDSDGKPRHMYRLTAAGLRLARVSLEEAGVAIKALKPRLRQELNNGIDEVQARHSICSIHFLALAPS